MSNTNDEIRDLAIKMAAFEGRMAGVEAGIGDIKLGLSGLMELREDLAKYSIHHEQFRNESKTMWGRIDQHRDEVAELRDTINHWKGALKMAGTIATILAAIGGAIITWTWAQVQAVPVLAEKVQQLEIRR